jgi:hypothetical protein
MMFVDCQTITMVAPFREIVPSLRELVAAATAFKPMAQSSSKNQFAFKSPSHFDARGSLTGFTPQW